MEVFLSTTNHCIPSIEFNMTTREPTCKRKNKNENFIFSLNLGGIWRVASQKSTHKIKCTHMKLHMYYLFALYIRVHFSPRLFIYLFG